jgi:hypothetical protein
MTTLGANGWPALWGVPGPDAPALPAPPSWLKPGFPPNCCDMLPGALGIPGWPGCSALGLPEAPSPAGMGLPRESGSVVCDDEGVTWAEPDGELEAPWEGEEVPEVVSFLFLDDFLSVALASCSC